MTLKAWCYVQGEKVIQPQTPYEARDSGWHCALEYNAFNVFDTFPYGEFEAWCKKTFPFGTYAIFIRNAWFLRESDAVLCKLRWS